MLSLEVMVREHLAHNMYPPMTALLCPALDAIRGNTDEHGWVSAPALGQNAWVPAHEVIRNLRLEAFIDGASDG